jgi:hypothetical protein
MRRRVRTSLPSGRGAIRRADFPRRRRLCVSHARPRVLPADAAGGRLGPRTPSPNWDMVESGNNPDSGRFSRSDTSELLRAVRFSGPCVRSRLAAVRYPRRCGRPKRARLSFLLLTAQTRMVRRLGVQSVAVAVPVPAAGEAANDAGAGPLGEVGLGEAGGAGTVHGLGVGPPQPDALAEMAVGEWLAVAGQLARRWLDDGRRPECVQDLRSGGWYTHHRPLSRRTSRARQLVGLPQTLTVPQPAPAAPRGGSTESTDPPI